MTLGETLPTLVESLVAVLTDASAASGQRNKIKSTRPEVKNITVKSYAEEHRLGGPRLTTFLRKIGETRLCSHCEMSMFLFGQLK